MRESKPYAAISNVSGSVRLARRRFLNEQQRKEDTNELTNMSKTEGIGNNESSEEESIERISEPTEEERQRIRAGFEEVKTAGAYGSKLHPLNESGEPLCSHREEHNVESWSNPKPIASYPPGYASFCRYCVREWRGSE
jgi:hypothetical protein